MSSENTSKISDPEEDGAAVERAERAERGMQVPFRPTYSRMPPPSVLLATTSRNTRHRKNKYRPQRENPSPFKPDRNFGIGTAATHYNNKNRSGLKEDSNRLSYALDNLNPFLPEKKKCSALQPIIHTRRPRSPKNKSGKDQAKLTTTANPVLEKTRRLAISIHYPGDPSQAQYESESLRPPMSTKTAQSGKSQDRTLQVSEYLPTTHRDSQGSGRNRQKSVFATRLADTLAAHSSDQHQHQHQLLLKPLPPTKPLPPSKQNLRQEPIETLIPTSETTSKVPLNILEIVNNLEHVTLSDEQSKDSLSLVLPRAFVGVKLDYSATYMAKLRSLTASYTDMRRYGYVMKGELEPWQLQKKKRCSDCKQPMPKLLRNPQISNTHSAVDGTIAELPASKLSKQNNRASPVSTPEASGLAKNMRKSGGTKENDPFAGLELRSMELNRLKIPMKSRIKFMEESAPPLPPPKESKPVSVLGAQKSEGLQNQPNKDDHPQKDKPLCKFHPGYLVQEAYSCCGGDIFSTPCAARFYHVPKTYAPGELKALWAFHRTPVIVSPERMNIRGAVALDCEMGISMDGESELIRITLIDYFTSEVLIDSLVYPDVQMLHYSTPFSGVTEEAMVTAIYKDKCIRGRDNAREAMFEFVGPQTVIVGHALYNDLNALRLCHTLVVDTFLMEIVKDGKKKYGDKVVGGLDNGMADTMGKGNGGNNCGDGQKVSAPEKGTKSLKGLALAKLGRKIQEGPNGHDSLEDAIASRDLTHWAVMNQQVLTS